MQVPVYLDVVCQASKNPNCVITCLQELAGFGITEAEIGSHMTAHPNLKTRGRL